MDIDDRKPTSFIISKKIHEDLKIMASLERLGLAEFLEKIISEKRDTEFKHAFSNQ